MFAVHRLRILFRWMSLQKKNVIAPFPRYYHFPHYPLAPADNPRRWPRA